jgi:hypothetical protein
MRVWIQRSRAVDVALKRAGPRRSRAMDLKRNRPVNSTPCDPVVTRTGNDSHGEDRKKSPSRIQGGSSRTIYCVTCDGM